MKGRYFHKKDFPQLKKLITSLQVKSVLEIGCGAGRLFELYDELNIPTIHAIELSDDLVQMAQKCAGRNIHVHHIDARQYEYQSLSCDMVLTHRVLQHIPENDIENLISKIVQSGCKHFYINENFNQDQCSLYLFAHDYTKLLEPHGYYLKKEGLIDEIQYSWRIYSRG